MRPNHVYINEHTLTPDSPHRFTHTPFGDHKDGLQVGLLALQRSASPSSPTRTFNRHAIYPTLIQAVYISLNSVNQPSFSILLYIGQCVVNRPIRPLHPTHPSYTRLHATNPPTRSPHPLKETPQPFHRHPTPICMHLTPLHAQNTRHHTPNLLRKTTQATCIYPTPLTHLQPPAFS